MEDNIYLCQQCQNIFKLPVSSVYLSEEESRCPKCGSSQIKEMSSWAPLGSNLDEGRPMWDCECQQCQTSFKIPVPGSPSQAKEARCPACGGKHIHRLTPAGFEPLYCG